MEEKVMKKMQEREREWISFLEKKGYEIEFDEYEWWRDVLHAVNIEKDERIPIAFVRFKYAHASLISCRYIIVSEENFEILKAKYVDREPIGIRDVWVDDYSCNLKRM